MSKLNTGFLKNIAETTGGKYFEITDTSDTSQQIMLELRNIKKNMYGKTQENSKTDRFQIFLFIAFLAFLLELVIPTAKKAEM